MSGETILITGAEGFTGRYLLEAAARAGYYCIALCRDDRNIPVNADLSVACDITDAPAVDKALETMRPDYVVHLAAISTVVHEDISEVYHVNLSGTLNLLQAVKKHAPGIRRILVASSATIYGNTGELPITENVPSSLVNHYAVSKYAMEQALSLEREMPWTVLRPFNYTGVGQNKAFLVPKIVEAFRRRDKSLLLGNLDVSRDFSDVRDVAEIYLRLLHNGQANSVYNICSGRPIALREIIRLLGELTGHEMEVSSDPALIRKNEIKISYGSNKRLQDALGHYAFREFTETLMWMLHADNQGQARD